MSTIKIGKKNVPEIPKETSKKKELERIFAIYKIQNPVKYEQKKASFEKRLAEL